MANQPPATPLFDAESQPPQIASVTAAADFPNPPNPANPPPANLAALPPWFNLSTPVSRTIIQDNKYATQDVSCVWVNPVPGVQTVEKRFGPKSRNRVYADLKGIFVDGDQDFFFHDVNANAGDGDVNSDGLDDDSDDNGDNGGNGENGENEDGSNGNIYTDNDGNGENGNGFVQQGGLGSDTDNMPVSVPPNETMLTLGFDDTNGAGVVVMEELLTILNGPPNNTVGTTDQPPAQIPAALLSGLHGLQNPRIPRVARARVNLTALSQRYNLYFAVYQNEIHVFRPQPAPEILRGPLVILRPPPTEAGRMLGGHMSQVFPHQANHIIVGDLGGVEIVLLAYDDGDVVAYYTRHIVAYLGQMAKFRHRIQALPKVPQPFFRETVGTTAWGLAVHSQSRLIAVSSNLAEVNVFAFALQPPKPDDPLQHKTQPLIVPGDDLSPTTYSGASALELESLLRLRDREWRILLPLGPTGHNIPSIDFISDANGIAEKVIAVDINGSIFILDIWKVGSRPLKIASPGKNGMDTGWGVLVVPAEMFLPTNKMPAPPDKRMLDRNYYPNIDGSLYFSYINDPSVAKPKPTPMGYDTLVVDYDSSSDDDMTEDGAHSTSYDGSEGGSDDGDDGNDGDDGEYGADGENSDEMRTEGAIYAHRRNDSTDSGPFTYDPATMSRHWDVLLKRNHTSNGLDSLDLKPAGKSGFHRGMIICPSIGLTWPTTNLPGLLRTLKNSRYRLDHSQEETLYQFRTPPSLEAEDMARRFFILRTYAATVEILNTDRSVPPFYIQNLLKPPTRLPFTLWDMDRDFHRCSLLHCIPEISLIIVGNMFGRVVLLRPLKNNRPQAKHAAPPWAFRTEWTLPLSYDEREGNRPPCCLLGIAVSPVPEPGSGQFGLVSTKKQDRPGKSRRWRLILHYMDHTILQYYIEETKPGVEKLGVHAV